MIERELAVENPPNQQLFPLCFESARDARESVLSKRPFSLQNISLSLPSLQFLELRLPIYLFQ